MARRHIIGVDLGGTNVRAAAVRDGRLDEVVAAPVNPQGSRDEVLDQLCALIERAAPRGAAGIGIGVPGLVDMHQGIVHDVVNIPSWKAVPLKAILEERYGVPVHVNNDANYFALGETHFGKGRGHASLIGLIVGTGFAAGIIIDGRLYAGANCGAGEFGMLPYRDSILEHYCAGLFFPRRAARTGAELYARAEQGHPEALAIFAEFGQHLGEGILGARPRRGAGRGGAAPRRGARVGVGHDDRAEREDPVARAAAARCAGPQPPADCTRGVLPVTRRRPARRSGRRAFPLRDSSTRIARTTPTAGRPPA